MDFLDFKTPNNDTNHLRRTYFEILKTKNTGHNTERKIRSVKIHTKFLIWIYGTSKYFMLILSPPSIIIIIVHTLHHFLTDMYFMFLGDFADITPRATYKPSLEVLKNPYMTFMGFQTT